MRNIIFFLIAGLSAQDKPVTTSVEDKLEISLSSTKFLNAKIDLNDKKEILRFAQEQVSVSTKQMQEVLKEREALLEKLTKKYKLVGSCNFDNIQAELTCKPPEKKKEGK